MQSASRFLVRITIVAAILYLVGGTLLFLVQDALIFPRPTQAREPVEGFDVVEYRTSDGLTLSGGYRPANAGMPTILYFHGNASDWQSSALATRRAVECGFGLLAASYRGYRRNPGQPSETGLYRDARAAMRLLSEQGVKPDRVILIGNSLGAGVALQLAMEARPQAIVLISPFSSLADLTGETVRLYPTRFMLRHRFENLRKLSSLNMPALILHGADDTVIPPHHAERLSKAAPHSRLMVIPNVGHELAFLPQAEDLLIAWFAEFASTDQCPRRAALGAR